MAEKVAMQDVTWGTREGRKTGIMISSLDKNVVIESKRIQARRKPRFLPVSLHYNSWSRGISDVPL